MLIKKNKQTQQQQQTKQAPFSSCSGGALTILHDLHQLMEIFYHDRIVDVQVSIFPEHFTWRTLIRGGFKGEHQSSFLTLKTAVAKSNFTRWSTQILYMWCIWYMCLNLATIMRSLIHLELLFELVQHTLCLWISVPFNDVKPYTIEYYVLLLKVFSLTSPFSIYNPLSATPLMLVVSDWETDISRLMCWILIWLTETKARIECTLRTAQLWFTPINYMEISEIIYSCI